MFDLIAGVLAWLYEAVAQENLGLAIVLLTIVVMVVMTPLTLSGTKSMIKMQRLQPELRKIQQKYKNDREKMNAEMMAFYQEHGVNPVGGCLPLFFQLPVFLVLYRVLQGLTRRHVTLGVDVGAAIAPGTGAADVVPSIEVSRSFNPQYLDESSELFTDLNETDEIPFLFDRFDLSASPLDAIRDNFVDGLPYLALILLVLGTSLYQQRQIQGRNPNAMANPQQAALMKIMPWFLPVISFSLQTALVLYFVVSNVYRIGQQAYITRTLYGPGAEPIPAAAAADDGAAKADKGRQRGGSRPAKRDQSRARGAASGKTKSAASTEKKSAADRGGQKAGGGRRRSSGNGTSSSSDKTAAKARRGAGAGRPTVRQSPSPSSRTGGRSNKNRKKKR